MCARCAYELLHIACGAASLSQMRTISVSLHTHTHSVSVNDRREGKEDACVIIVHFTQFAALTIFHWKPDQIKTAIYNGLLCALPFSLLAVTDANRLKNALDTTADSRKKGREKTSESLLGGAVTAKKKRVSRTNVLHHVPHSLARLGQTQTAIKTKYHLMMRKGYWKMNLSSRIMATI